MPDIAIGWGEVVALIVSGVLVGFINTLAGGGSIISLSMLMFLGLPAPVANGTNRIAIFVQTITAVGSFRQQKVLDYKKGLILAIPAVVGAVIGAYIAVDINEKIFERAMAVIMLLMLVFILYNPKKWLYGSKDLQERKVGYREIIIFFGIGIYGGFIHMGVGYLLLASLLLGIGYDLVRANAVKVMIVMLYIPFSLVVFLINDQVNWAYGLILTIGNVIGAFVASRLAVKKGVNFVRWVIVIVILLTSGHLFDLYDIQALIGIILNK
jgi:uncharacterized membrane protein YfcA